MYIPAENVYYETIIKDGSEEERNLSQYALSKGVIPVSPNSLYAYLQAIVLRLKGLKVEERAKEIIQYLSRLRGGFGNFGTILACWGNIWGMLSPVIKLPRNVWSSSARDFFLPMRTKTSSNLVHTIARWDSRLIRKQRGFLLCG